MNKEDFQERFNQLKNKHGLLWEWSCDLLSIADVLVYKDDILITTIEVDTPDGREKGINDIEQYFITN